MLLECAEYGVCISVGPRREAGPGKKTLVAGTRSLDFILRAREDTRGYKTRGELGESIVTQCEVYILKTLL